MQPKSAYRRSTKVNQGTHHYWAPAQKCQIQCFDTPSGSRPACESAAGCRNGTPGLQDTLKQLSLTPCDSEGDLFLWRPATVVACMKFRSITSSRVASCRSQETRATVGADVYCPRSRKPISGIHCRQAPHTPGPGHPSTRASPASIHWAMSSAAPPVPARTTTGTPLLRLLVHSVELHRRLRQYYKNGRG